MPKTKLNTRTLKTLASDKKTGEIWYDTEVRGFGVRVMPSGRKVFIFQYGDRERRRKITIGEHGSPWTVDQARDEAKRLQVAILSGEDPQDVKAARKAMPTFAEWAETRKEDIQARLKRPDAQIVYLDRAVEHFGRTKLDELTAPEIRKAMAIEAKRGETNVSANRWFEVVRATLNAAVHDGIIEKNPANTIKKLPEPPPRTRILKEDELDRVLAALADEPDPTNRAAIFCLIATGLRKSELLRTRWEDIDFENGIWRLPVTKSGRPQVIPLPSIAADELQRLPRIGEWVFPSPKNQGEHLDDIKRPWQRIRTRAGIENVSIHDLRRTFGARVAKTAGLHMASRLLRHTSVKVTERHYAPLDFEDLREATEAAISMAIPQDKKSS